MTVTRSVIHHVASEFRSCSKDLRNVFLNSFATLVNARAFKPIPKSSNVSGLFCSSIKHFLFNLTFLCHKRKSTSEKQNQVEGQMKAKS